MIEINFGPHAGGRRSFKSGQELEAVLASENKLWGDEPVVIEASPQGGAREGVAINRIHARWGQLLNNVRSWVDQFSDNLGQVAALTEGSALADVHLIGHDSPAGKMIVRLHREVGLPAAAGAAEVAQARPTDTINMNMNPAMLDGALRWWAFENGFTVETVTHAQEGIAATLDQVAVQTGQHRMELQALEDTHKAALDDIRQKADEHHRHVSESLKRLNDQLDSETAARAKDWQGLFAAYDEHLGIEAPVRLWNTRSRQHRKAAKVYGGAVAIVAAAGIIAGLILVDAAIGFAKGLFSDFATQHTDPLGLRPTWRYEIGLVAALMLLYITLLLWGLRLIVRMFMTEHHLSIDAASRANMARTYLALTKRNAAEPADRAIVLGSLFRPVVDGIVRDDAMPTITPAALLSGQLAGGGRSGQ